MRRTIPIILLACVALGCGGSSDDPAENATTVGESLFQPAPDLQYYELEDPKTGMVMAVSPIPASWKVDPTPGAEVYITGPNGLRVSPTQTDSYGWSADPFMRESIAMSGQQMAPVRSLEEIHQQHVVPQLQAQGKSLVGVQPLPEVEGFWARFNAGMLETGSRRQWQALGSEWSDGRGTKSLVVLVQIVSQQGQAIWWSLQNTVLEAAESDFVEAKAAYLYAVGNTHINPQWQQVANGQLRGQIKADQDFAAQMMAQSRAAHQQRMAAIQARGNAALEAGKTYSDILDINHSGYLSRSDINSAGHSALIDTTLERTMIGNHETGEHYYVDSGSKYYWVNHQGEYFGTDNPNYDPRLDRRMDDEMWSKFVAEQ